VIGEKRLYLAALIWMLVANFAHAATTGCSMEDMDAITKHRLQANAEKKLEALGIDKLAPLTPKAVTEVDKSVNALREQGFERLSEGDRNVPREVTRFEGFLGDAEVKAAEEQSVPKPVAVEAPMERNFSTTGNRVSYTNGVYEGPKEHANVGLYPGTFDPPNAAHIDTIKRSLAEGKLDEVYIFVNRDSALKTDFSARQKMAEFAFGGDSRVKFIDPASYKNANYPDVLRDIAAKNRKNIVTSISGNDVLEAGYFKPARASNVRYLVATRSEDADMVKGAIENRFGEALKRDPELVKRIDLAAGERQPNVPEAVAKYVEERKLYEAPEKGRALASVTPEAEPVRFSLVSKNDEGLKARLEGAIKQGFDLGEKPLLSGAARIPTYSQSAERLRETGGLWAAVRPDQKLTAELDKIIAKGKVSKTFADNSKELRARLKTMRFLCEALCTEKSQLKQLDQLTKAFGHLDDAAKPGFGSRKQIAAAAATLREEMSASKLKAIDHELLKMEPLKAGQLANRLEDDIKSIRKSIYATEVTETEFHEVRKNIGRMQTMVLTNALSEGGKAKEKGSYQVFHDLYEKIGDVHDDMVKSNLHAVDVGQVSFNDVQRGQIEKVLGYFEKSDRIEPGKLPKGAQKFADREVRYSLVRTDSEAGLSDQNKALIKNGSNTGEKPVLSGVARIPLRQETEERMQQIAKLWAEVRPGETLKSDLADISRTGTVSDKFLADSKELRARMKVMRFFCEALCTDETQLERLDKLTKTFGHLSDAATPGFGSKDQIRQAASELRDSLGKGNLDKIDRELAKMQPLRATELANRLQESFVDMRKAIYSPAVTEKDFHEVRKTIGRMQTILLSNAFTESGTKEEKASFQAFRKLYDHIGDEHDEMVKAELQGNAPEKITFSPSQRAQVEQLISYFEKNDRIEPGKLPKEARKYTDRDVRFSLVAQESGAGLSSNRDQALSAVRSGYAAHYNPEASAAFTDGLSRRLADSKLDSSVVHSAIEGSSTGRRTVEEAAEFTEQLAGKLATEGYDRTVVTAAVGGAVGGPRTASEAVNYARIVADDLKAAGFETDSIASALRGSIGGKLSAEEAVAYSRNVAADLKMDGFDQPTINAALRGGSSGDLTAKQASSFTRELTSQMKDAGLPKDVSVAAVQGSLGKHLEVAEARVLAKDLVGKLTQQGFDHETILAVVEGGASNYSSADRTIGYARMLAGDPATSHTAGTALTMVAAGGKSGASRSLASVENSVADTLSELKASKSVSPEKYYALLEKASPSEKAEIRTALGSKVAVTTDGDQRFLNLAGLDRNRSEYREFLKEESDKPVQALRNGYDKTKTIARMNATFNGFEAEEENTKFIEKAELANLGRESSIKRSFLVETAVTKDLNDSVVKNKELVTSLMNKHKNMMWDAMSRDKFITDNLDVKYNDFKSMKFGFKTNNPEIDHRMKAIFTDVNTRYSDYLASLVKEKGWDQKATGLAADVGNWTHMGIGATPDEANWAARQSRTMLDSKGLAHPRTFAEVEDRASSDLNEIARLRKKLASDLGAVPGMFVKEGDKKVLSAEAIEAVRKAKAPAGSGEEAMAAEIKKTLDARFARNFTEQQISDIRDYAAKVDAFSPDLYLARREEIPLDFRSAGIVSADFKGQNARNIEQSLRALAREEGQPLTSQMRELRKGEKMATAELDLRKGDFAAAFCRKDPSCYTAFGGDDGFHFPSAEAVGNGEHLSQQQKEQYAKAVSHIDIRLTFNRHRFAETGQEIATSELSGLVGEAEEMEKNLRKDMIHHFPRELVNRTRLAIDMTPQAPGKSSFGVMVLGTKDSEDAGVQKWARGYLEDHGYSTDYVKVLKPNPPTTVARGETIYGLQGLAQLDRDRPALAAVVRYEQSATDALADARRRYLGRTGTIQELQAAESLYGHLATPVIATDESGLRVSYFAQEEHYLAQQVARASLDGDAAAAGKFKVEQAAVTAQMLGEQQARELSLVADAKLGESARRSSVESLIKNFDRNAADFAGRSLDEVAGNSAEAGLLKAIGERDAQAGAKAARDSRANLESVVKEKLTTISSKLEARKARTEALTQDIVDLHASNGSPADLVKRSPDRWNSALVDSCVKENLCSPRLEARTAETVGRELSPEARRIFAQDRIAAAEPGAAKEALAASKLPAAKNFDDAMARLTAERKRLAADAERLSKSLDMKVVEADTRQALASVDEKIRTLSADQSVLKDAPAITSADRKLGDEAAEATLSYVDRAKPAELEKLGLYNVAAVKGERKGAVLGRVQEQLREMPAEKRSKVVAAVYEDASKGSGPFAKELQKTTLDPASLAKAIDHGDRVTLAAGMDGGALEKAVLTKAKVPSSVQALADAMGATKAGTAPAVARAFDIAKKIKALEAETKRLAAPSARAPASIAKESMHEMAERVFGSLRTVTEAQRKEIGEGLDTVMKYEKGAKGENNARRILDTLKALAANPATKDQFDTDRLAFVDAVKVLPQKKKWPAAWEEGVKQMLRDSSYADAEINKVVDEASGTRFYQKTALCLGL
jgi:nicotinic acid mononucleotide adenylyltransferase